jgi:metal transporter CNNM
MYATILIVIILVLFSAICSGLNVSLMSLNAADLKRKKALGNIQASIVYPLRAKPHLSLASILLTNVAVISTTSLVLEHKYNGLIAGIASTLLIVIFGEIMPQAYFLKNALFVTALFAPILRIMIIVTYPVAKPLASLLDHFFGKEKGALHTRRELGLIISEHLGHKESELDEDEVEIIRGALKLSETHVSDIMTPIKNVFSLKPDAIIDDKMIDKIKTESFSRIPILGNSIDQPGGVLLMKDLVDIDFDERSYSVSELPVHKLHIVGARTALDTMFRKFIAAHTHLMAIEKNDKIVGIVTIEDLLEEIIGHEIEDESDVARI